MDEKSPVSCVPQELTNRQKKKRARNLNHFLKNKLHSPVGELVKSTSPQIKPTISLRHAKCISDRIVGVASRGSTGLIWDIKNFRGIYMYFSEIAMILNQLGYKYTIEIDVPKSKTCVEASRKNGRIIVTWGPSKEELAVGKLCDIRNYYMEYTHDELLRAAYAGAISRVYKNSIVNLITLALENLNNGVITLKFDDLLDIISKPVFWNKIPNYSDKFPRADSKCAFHIWKKLRIHVSAFGERIFDSETTIQINILKKCFPLCLETVSEIGSADFYNNLFAKISRDHIKHGKMILHKEEIVGNPKNFPNEIELYSISGDSDDKWNVICTYLAHIYELNCFVNYNSVSLNVAEFMCEEILNTKYDESYTI